MTAEIPGHIRQPSSNMKLVVPLAGVSLALALPAAAAVTGQALGTAPPPGMIITIPGNEGDVLTSLPSEWGTIHFSLSLEIANIGSNWATWSHGYVGKVMASDPSLIVQPTSLTIDLPPNTEAFFFYIAPNVFFTPSGAPVSITAQALGGPPISQNILSLDGAVGFLFSGSGGDFISQVLVSIPADADGWAIGELGIIPEGNSALALVALAGLAAGYGFRRRRRA